MKNYNKIYPAEINQTVEQYSYTNFAKEWFSKLLPFSRPVFFTGFAVAAFLIFQLLLVGIFDILGVSPKYSLIISGLTFATLFASLAIVGGIKRKEKTLEHFEVEQFETARRLKPICKLLIIKRKKINKRIKL